MALFVLKNGTIQRLQGRAKFAHLLHRYFGSFLPKLPRLSLSVYQGEASALPFELRPRKPHQDALENWREWVRYGPMAEIYNEMNETFAPKIRSARKKH